MLEELCAPQAVPWSIGKIVEKWAVTARDKTALIIDDRSITYGELNRRTNRLAHQLQELGLRKGDRIAGMTENNYESVLAYLAAAKLGLVCVPLNNRLLAEEVYYQLENSGASAIVFDAKFAEQIKLPVERLALSKERVLCNGLHSLESAESWSSCYELSTHRMPENNPILEETVYLHDPLAIVYTSGTTGAPKGAVTNHQQTFFKCFQVMLYLDLRADDVWVSHMPLFHSAGLFIVLTPILARGATLVTSRAFDPVRFAKDCRRYQGTLTMGSTTMWKMILKDYDVSTQSFASVRVTLGGGERTPVSLLEEMQAIGLNVQLGFGQTENSFMALQEPGDAFGYPGSVGRPGFFTDVWIEEASGEAADAGITGAIVAQGPTVMSGYWDMPEKTAETLVDGVLRTGDLGYMDEDSHIFLVDREKDMYRSGAENVYPAEVEKVLIDHPAVFNAAIIGVPDERWGETGKAYVVLMEGAAPNPEELIRWLDGRIARYKHPKHFEFVSELPTTETGKVKKIVLKRLSEGGTSGY